ncbi:lysine-sensitive aspartokinase 3 [Flocculibacter collagenilyticus]|uniref:lysine-sensitive aspartokinase 3 n=1 Tax=Flocculibacter collagenilyticus TaxID=2744479 RepID=UPI0018F60986|nr:lysine-sensitive aspartokinase 3 [Flocculibacter collagenilyticus]
MKNNIVVAKFGGTSLADFAAMQRCASLVLNSPTIKVVVVSASSGVTNLLTKLTKPDLLTAKREALLNKILAIHSTILDQLEQSDHQQQQLLNLHLKLADLAQSASIQPNIKDEILSFGEQISSLLFTEVLNQLAGNQIYKAECFDVRKILKTDNQFGNAVPNINRISELATHYFSDVVSSEDKGHSHVMVTQGFIGATEHGETTTLGRGGSDFSAALLAEAINATELQIWTDVKGIFTTDPRLTTNAKPISEISFDEAAELATFGAKVLHPATLLPAMRANIPVYVGSSLAPTQGGTKIVKSVENKPTYRAIALRKNQTLITIKSPAMLHATGFLAKVFGILSQHHISVDLITTSEISIAITLDNSVQNAEQQFYKHCMKALQAFCEIQVESDLSLIALIGNHLHANASIMGNNGIEASVFQSLNNISMRMICYGASQHNVCFLVKDNEAVSIISKLHQHLFEGDTAVTTGLAV